MGYCALITVTEITRNYASMWNRTFPFISNLVRKTNLQSETFDDHILSKTVPARRALVNEIGFRMFEKVIELKRDELDETIIGTLTEQTCKYIAGLEQTDTVSLPDTNEKEESSQISLRLKQYFDRNEKNIEVLVSPVFTGCGVISSCVADVLAGDTLYEIKAGEREFRVSDIKQLIVYSTLNFSRHRENIKNIALLNPRLGKFVKFNLKESIEIASGKAAADAFYEFINYFDNPDDFR